MNRRFWLCLAAFLALPALASAQSAVYYQPHFPPEEFKARWEKIYERIGPSAAAIVQGMPKVNGFIFPRQNNEFYYLCGIETPHSYIVLDGKTRKATLYLPPRDRRLESAEGKILCADDAEQVKKLTGVDDVLKTQKLKEGQTPALDAAATIYTLFSPAEGAMQSRYELQAANDGIKADYWDGRMSREANFAELLRKRFPKAGVKDLTQILDSLRAVKSPREIALIRRASQLAGLGLIDAMKSTKPGVYEYQLDAAARFVFITNGARLESYRSIVGAGRANIWNMHYYRNNAELKEGDLVLMDYAPDFGCYVSDIARMWPVNGKFDPEQRELLQFVLEYRNAIMKRIRPSVDVRQIMNEAKVAMEPVFQKTKFSKPIYERAAHTLVDRGGGVFSHPVGMAVHDDGNYANGPLRPGHVFSIDPQLRVAEERIYMRYEDVVVVTDKGYENFTDFLPTELNDIEKLVGQGGLVQKLPPVAEGELLRAKAIPNPSVATIGGTGQAGYSGDGGPATRAAFNQPFVCAADGKGGLLVADALNHCIRRIDGKGIVTTVAGTGKKGYAGDSGPATQATMNEPYAMTVDGDGNLYIVDRLNAALRRVDGHTGIMTPLAGTGVKGFNGDGGPAEKAQFREPNDCHRDGKGGLLIADVADWRIRRVDLRTGNITTFAGVGRPTDRSKAHSSGDGGPARDAVIAGSRAVCVDARGNTYVCEREGNVIRKIDPSGIISTVAGTGQKGFTGDGGSALQATLNGPKGLRCDREGNLIIADCENHAIRVVDMKTGIISTKFGGAGKPGARGELNRPHGCMMDDQGALIIADTENHRVLMVH